MEESDENVPRTRKRKKKTKVHVLESDQLAYSHLFARSLNRVKKSVQVAIFTQPFLEDIYIYSNLKASRV